MIRMFEDQKVKFTINGVDYMRQPTEIYSRTMGYYRPVSQYNPGKRSEFYSRKYFDEMKSANSDFIGKFS